MLAVKLLFRSKALELPHVVEKISAYADSSVELPLSKACSFNSLELLEKLWGSDVESSWSVRKLLKKEQGHYQQFQFTKCLCEAGKLHNLEMVAWLFEHFKGYEVEREALEAGAEVGALDILQLYLRHEYKGSDEDDDEEEDGDDGDRVVHWGGKDLEKAARAGRGDVALWLLENTAGDGMNVNEVTDAAVEGGSVELVSWLMRHFRVHPTSGFPMAAANNRIGLINWWFDLGYRLPTGTLLRAAENGRLEIVRLMIQHDWDDEDHLQSDDGGYDDYESEYERRSCDVTRYDRWRITCVGCEASLSIHAAAINGHLEVAQYLRAHVDTALDERDRDNERRNLASVKKALKDQLGGAHDAKAVSAETMLLAAKRGFLDVVQWLFEEVAIDPSTNLFWVHRDDFGIDSYDSAIDAAAGSGHLEIVQYLHRKGREAVLDAATTEKPVSLRKRKRSRIFYYLHGDSDDDMEGDDSPKGPTKPGCSTTAMDEAAAHNHMHVVQWLHENRTEGCTTDAMDGAARNGHLEMVKWLNDHRKEGCTTEAMDGAASGGHLAVVKWFHEQGWAGCTDKAMDGAAGGGHLDVVKWLHESRTEGCTTRAMDGAAARGALDVVKFLHKNRSEGCTMTAMDLAAWNDHIRVVRWLHENRSEGCTANAMDDAARNGHFEMVMLLRANRKEGCSSAANVSGVPRTIYQWLVGQYPHVLGGDEDD